jgi:hypothetical protein
MNEKTMKGKAIISPVTTAKFTIVMTPEFIYVGSDSKNLSQDAELFKDNPYIFNLQYI